MKLINWQYFKQLNDINTYIQDSRNSDPSDLKSADQITSITWSERAGSFIVFWNYDKPDDRKDDRKQLCSSIPIAFDFDGVIHKYREGWLDGSIYDEYNKDVIQLMYALASAQIPCVIISTRDPDQIEEWWNQQNFDLPAKVIDPDTKFYNNVNVVGITNRKIGAQLYIDDRGYRYEGQSINDFFKDFKVSCKDLKEQS